MQGGDGTGARSEARDEAGVVHEGRSEDGLGLVEMEFINAE